MKHSIDLPALRSEIGDWIYYITTFSYSDLEALTVEVKDVLYGEYGGADALEAMDNDGGQSDIDKQLQRDKDDSHIDDIEFYIKNEPQMFFNSLVLAVFNDYPNWSEFIYEYKDENYSNEVGILSFSEDSKLIAVDGQHRLAAIKKVLKENPDKKDDKISVLVVGHSNDEKGIQRSRRLFTTLNKRAKRVGEKELIILDEDNSACIITRKLYNNKIIEILNKKMILLQNTESIKSSSKFSSIMTINYIHEQLLLYFLDINIDIKKKFMEERGLKKITISDYKNRFKRIKPNEEILLRYEKYVLSYWQTLINSVDDLKVLEESLKNNNEINNLRTSDNNNAIYRPVFLKNLIQVIISVSKKENIDIIKVISRLENIDLSLYSFPWNGLLWNDSSKTIQNTGIVKALKKTLEYLLTDNDSLSKTDQLVKEYYEQNHLYEKDENTKEQNIELIINRFKSVHPNNKLVDVD